MTELKVPIITIVIGEGGSGGALALGVSDYLAMLEFSTYSVISPEGCASILWKKAEMAEVAADSLSITSSKLKKLGLVDEIISEPLGGAHNNYDLTMTNVKKTLKEKLAHLKQVPTDDLLKNRYERLTSFGQHSQSEK